MKKSFINITFTAEPESLIEKINDRGSKTTFLAFCMHACGINRIYSQEDVQEFLYRLAIVFQHEKIISKYFTDSSLITYKDRGISNTLCLVDVKDHLGLEVFDRRYNNVPREKWMEFIDIYLRGARYAGYFTGKGILDTRIIGLNKFGMNSEDLVPITDEYHDAAILFATKAATEIGEDAFVDLFLRLRKR